MAGNGVQARGEKRARAGERGESERESVGASLEESLVAVTSGRVGWCVGFEDNERAEVLATGKGCHSEQFAGPPARAVGWRGVGGSQGSSGPPVGYPTACEGCWLRGPFPEQKGGVTG